MRLYVEIKKVNSEEGFLGEESQVKFKTAGNTREVVFSDGVNKASRGMARSAEECMTNKEDMERVKDCKIVYRETFSIGSEDKNGKNIVIHDGSALFLTTHNTADVGNNLFREVDNN